MESAGLLQATDDTFLSSFGISQSRVYCRLLAIEGEILCQKVLYCD